MIGWFLVAAAVLAAGAVVFAVVSTVADRHLERVNRWVIEHGRIADSAEAYERYQRWIDTPPEDRP